MYELNQSLRYLQNRSIENCKFQVNESIEGIPFPKFIEIIEMINGLVQCNREEMLKIVYLKL